MKKARSYQLEAKKAVNKALKKGILKQLIVQATGSGKTYLASNIALDYDKTLWVTHREELIDQSGAALAMSLYDNKEMQELLDYHDGYIKAVRHYEKNYASSDCEKFFAETFGLVKAESNSYNKKITLASVQTLHRRLGKINPGTYELVVIDEAHLFMANTFKKVMDHFTPDLTLGLTATPTRLDGKSLYSYFDKIVFDYGLREAITDGWLVEIDAIRCRTNVDLNKVHTLAGDFNQKELRNVVNIPERNNLIVDKYLEYAEGKQAIFYCVDIQHTKDLADTFYRRGIKSVNIIVSDKKLCPDRADIMRKFKKGEIDVICNVDILTTGFDYPELAVIGAACPTKSLVKYMQCLDDKTQVLTNNGWKDINTISYYDLVAGYNIENQKISWEFIDEIMIRPLANNEEMYGINLPQTDIRITGGHRMIQSKRKGRSRKYESLEFIDAQDFANNNDNVKIPISGIQLSKGLSLSKAELIFLGLFLSDGCINERRNQMYICQSIDSPVNKEIVKCLKDCDIPYRISSVKRTTEFKVDSIMNYYHIGVDWIRVYDEYLYKDLSKAYENIIPEQLDHLIYGINLGDGSKYTAKSIDWKPATYCISTGNEVFVDNLQSLCIRKGFKCNFSKTKTGFNLHIKPNELFKTLSFSSNDKRDKFQQVEAYIDDYRRISENVWCLSNRLQTLVTRRNGKVTILGNCIGRGTRPIASAIQGIDDSHQRRIAIKESKKSNLILLDFVDVTSRHHIVNSWELDKKLPLDERVFMTSEDKDEMREQIARSHEIERSTDTDVRVDLLQLPVFTISTSPRMQEPASPAQLQLIASLGYDVSAVGFTKADASVIIGNNTITQYQLQQLNDWGYDTTNAPTYGEYKAVLEAREKKGDSTSSTYSPSRFVTIPIDKSAGPAF